jgi:long-chain acyl-CoA synthetase
MKSPAARADKGRMTSPHANVTHQITPPDGPRNSPAPSWLTRESVIRVLRDLVRSEINAVAPGRYSDADAAAWNEGTELGKPPAEIDSIELIGISARVHQVFHIHESGLDDYLLADRRLGVWADVVLRARAEYDHELTFLTSGSTGIPKACTHATESLHEEVSILAERFAGRGRIVSFVPSHHLYGFLFTVMLPQRLGIPVLDARTMGPGGLLRELRETDLLVSFPASWEALSRSVPRLPGAVGVCSTGSCKPSVARALQAAGLRELIDIYGSTESAGIGWRSSGEELYELHPYWSRDPERPEALRRKSGEGESVLFEPMDRLEFRDDRRFSLAGRVDHAVKVAGLNVFPSRVAELLGSHRMVESCSVRLMRPEEGDRLKAFIVPRGEGTDLKSSTESLRRELDQWCAEHLAPAERPKSWSFGPSLPQGAMGKNADW